jgi:hypothetical protein
MKILVSWTVRAEGETSGATLNAHGWADVWPILAGLQGQAGTLSLDLLDAPDPGPMSMQLVCESGLYLVTLLEATEDDDHVRCYTNPNAVAEMIEVLGDRWDARQLTGDFDLVLRMFQSFCETGDVARQWLR